MGKERLIFLIAIANFLLSTSAFASSPRIFLVQSYAPNMWTRGIESGLFNGNELKSLPVKKYYFDSDFWGKKGLIKDAKDEKLTLFLSDLTSDDLLIISDDEAASVIISTLKNSGPVLILGINGSRTSSAWSPFCEGDQKHAVLFEDYPYEEALALAQKKFPGLSTINAIGGDTPTSKKMISDLKEFLVNKSMRLEKSLTSSLWSDWRDNLSAWNHPKNVTWVFVPYGLRDSMNEEIDPSLVSGWMKKNLKNALIGALALKDGVDITVGLDPKDLGQEAAKIAKKLLASQTTSCRNKSMSYKIAQRIDR